MSSPEAGPSRQPQQPRVLRVSQIDADDLDDGLVSMLGEKVERALSNFRASINLDIKPEVGLLIRLAIYKLGIMDPATRASPGAKLQNLKLISGRDPKGKLNRRTLMLHFLLHTPLFPAYLYTRLRLLALSRQWPDLPRHTLRRKLWTLIGHLENFGRVWETVGWGMFLYDGVYPSLLMRILKVRLVPKDRFVSRMVSYEFMNRQLVWATLTEFLMFLLPVLQPLQISERLSAATAKLTQALKRPTAVDYTPSAGSNSKDRSAKSDSRKPTGRFAHLPRQTCAICHLRLATAPIPLGEAGSASSISLPPVDAPGVDDEETKVFVPANTDCWSECVYCYYCITGTLLEHQDAQERLEVKTAWECLRCGGQVHTATRAVPDAVVANDTNDIGSDKETE